MLIINLCVSVLVILGLYTNDWHPVVGATVMVPGDSGITEERGLVLLETCAAENAPVIIQTEYFTIERRVTFEPVDPASIIFLHVINNRYLPVIHRHEYR